MIHFSERLRLADLYDRWRKENKVADVPFSVISFIQHIGALDECRVHQYLDGALRARDYTKIPGYEDMPNLTARYNYLHDLLEQYSRLPDERRGMDDYRCRRPEFEAQKCPECPLWVALERIGIRSTCCSWAAESKPDEAIVILEQLLKEENEMSRRNWFYEPEPPLVPPEGKSYFCPVCGEANPDRYFRSEFSREIVGCNHCIEELDAEDWELDHEE